METILIEEFKNPRAWLTRHGISKETVITNATGGEDCNFLLPIEKRYESNCNQPIEMCNTCPIQTSWKALEWIDKIKENTSNLLPWLRRIDE